MNHYYTIHPGTIGFDIDGVVADTMEAFIRLADEEHGITVQPDQITEFEVEKCLDIDPYVIEDIFLKLLNKPVNCGLQPMIDSVGVLQEFARHAPLTFITARPTKEPIAEWLYNFLGQETYENTRLIAMGKHDSKASYVKKMDLSYFVDDRAQTCISLKEEGIIPMVFSQPWNHGKHSLDTVDDWLSIRSLCMTQRNKD